MINPDIIPALVIEVKVQSGDYQYRIGAYEACVSANCISVIGRTLDAMNDFSSRRVSDIAKTKMRAKAICAEAWEIEITKLFAESYEVDSRAKHNNYLAF